MIRPCLALLLICACAGVSAREVRLQSPNGETGTCPQAEAAPATDVKHIRAAGPARKPAGKPTRAQGGGGGDDASIRNQGPRWHSFLPGMFR
jgi:hypothetical protein